MSVLSSFIICFSTARCSSRKAPEMTPTRNEPRFRALSNVDEPKEFRHADALNNADIDLPGQHLGPFILQEFLELMHEDDKIQGIQSSIDEIV